MVQDIYEKPEKNDIFIRFIRFEGLNHHIVSDNTASRFFSCVKVVR